MIKHIVFWKILKDGNEQDRYRVYENFEEKTSYLKSIIPEIQEAHIGLNSNDGDVFHICIDSVFASVEDLNRYIEHPEHLKVRDYMNSVSYEKTVFDYTY